MRLSDCEFKKLLPLFMRKEPDDAAIAGQLDPVIREFGVKAKWVSDWGYIDFLPEEWVDALAWELDIDWYAPKSDKSLDVRRELVKNADMVNAHLGTKAAVESVSDDIFGESEVLEWFDYSGSPGHFKIITHATLTPELFDKFKATIEGVKNARSHLDAIEIERNQEQTLYTGCANQSNTANVIMDGGYRHIQEIKNTIMYGNRLIGENINIIL